jgi:hypothetical protein
MGNRLLLQIVEHRSSRAVADVPDTGASDLHGCEDTVRRDQLPIAEPLRLKIAHGFVIVLAFEREHLADGVAEIHVRRGGRHGSGSYPTATPPAEDEERERSPEGENEYSHWNAP